MTRKYDSGSFPSATFCVLSNGVVAIVAAAALTLWKHGTVKLPAPFYAVAPSAAANFLSSFGQYQALRYVPFPLQTLSKSTKIIPVMLMGKLLNSKSYRWDEYAEALVISAGVTIFSFSENSGNGDATTQLIGVLLLALNIMFASFTSQYQSRVYRDFPSLDQFHMMFAMNGWTILLTLAVLLASGELWTTLAFLGQEPDAVWDNLTMAVTSATGQLCIFYTIKEFGPVVFTMIMTTRQMLSMMFSAVMFGHAVGALGYLGTALVFATVFRRLHREAMATSGSNGPGEKPSAEMLEMARSGLQLSLSPSGSNIGKQQRQEEANV